MKAVGTRSAAPLLLVAVLAAIGAAAAAGEAATLNVGQNEKYPTISAAAAIAQNGDHILIDPGHYAECAIWHADNLVIEGAGPGVVIGEKSCIGKGIFVIDGNNTTIRRLTLAHAQVPDKNGSGIRLEHGNLTVDGVTFIENEMGILGGATGATVTIRNSVFERDGRLGQQWGHAVYIGEADLVRVIDSRFSETRQGHSIKSRALRTEVTGCTITDGPDGTSSYLIDVPNGGALVVHGNTLEKGPKSDNAGTAIAIGEEGNPHPTPEITVTDNTFRNDSDHETAFVSNRTDTPASVTDNRFYGPVIALSGPGTAR
jgi:hypothetical protein